HFIAARNPPSSYGGIQTEHPYYPNPFDEKGAAAPHPTGIGWLQFFHRVAWRADGLLCAKTISSPPATHRHLMVGFKQNTRITPIRLMKKVRQRRTLLFFTASQSL
ncbi:MAG: hypothetical protein GYA48_18260, partial [Chloroflexi bacterium]|nr:hypothetical protein [Chloroflexota bacterium]